jgi:hypothetical protein
MYKHTFKTNQIAIEKTDVCGKYGELRVTS